MQSVYRLISDNLKKIDDWNCEKRLGGALGVVVHTACHLGAIRQMLNIVNWLQAMAGTGPSEDGWLRPLSNGPHIS